MPPTKTYKTKDGLYDIPDDNAKPFLEQYPDAQEVKSFINNAKDTFDVPIDKVEAFKTQYPTAKPLFEETQQAQSQPIAQQPTALVPKVDPNPAQPIPQINYQLKNADKLKLLAPELHQNAINAQGLAKENTLQDLVKDSKGANRTIIPNTAIDINAAHDEKTGISGALADVDRFSDNLVGKHTETGYIGTDGQPLTSFKLGDILAVPKDKTLGDGNMYPTGFIQLTESANGVKSWRGVSAPDPTFQVAKQPLQDVVVTGYKKKGAGSLGYSKDLVDGQTDNTDDYNHMVDMLRKKDSDIDEAGYFDGVAKLGASKEVNEALHSNFNSEGSKRLPWFLLKNKEVLPAYDEIIKTHPTLNTNSEGSFKALQDAVIKTYSLDKPSQTPLESGAPDFYSMVNKSKELQPALEQLSVLKGAYEKESDATRKEAIGQKINTLMATIQPQQKLLQDYFQKPEIKQIIDLADKQQKGFATLSQVNGLFPNRETDEEKKFQAQHEDLNALQKVLNPIKSIYYGAKQGANELVDFTSEKINALGGWNADELRQQQRTNDQAKQSAAANDYIKKYDSSSTAGDVGNFINSLGNMLGGMAPAIPIGGGTTLAKVGTSLYFGATAAQSTINEYREQGLSEGTANLAGLTSGAAMALITYGLGGKSDMEGFKPSFKATQMLLDPALKDEGAKLLSKEVFNYKGSKFIESLGSSTKSAAEMKLAGLLNAGVNGLVNNKYGTDLNTDTGNIGDFLSNVLSFNLAHHAMGVFNHGEFTPEKKTALINYAATGNMKAAIDGINELLRQPDADKNQLRKNRSMLEDFAGLSFPKGITAEQKTLLYLEHEKKQSYQEAADKSDFPEYYKNKIKEADNNIADILSNPAGANGQVQKVVKPVMDKVKEATANPLGLPKEPESTMAATDSVGSKTEHTENPTIKKSLQVEPVQDVTIGEIIDKPVTYKGQNGTLTQDGQTVIFRTNDGKREYELGNADEIKNSPTSDFGLTHEQSVVSVNDENDITVRGTPYNNLYSDPLAAINRDSEGNIISVNLETADGKKRTFKKGIAEDLAYQIHLKEINKTNETRKLFENYINEEPATREEINNGGLPKVAEEKPVADNAPVQRIPKEESTIDNASDSEAHRANIHKKFRKEFGNNASTEQVDGALALMDARAKSWASEQNGRNPADWYSKIADVKNGDFEDGDIQYQNGKLKAGAVGALSLLGQATDDMKAPEKNATETTVSQPKSVQSVDITDGRKSDLASSLPVGEKNNKSQKGVDVNLIKNIVHEANKRGIDPYTALSMTLQESSIGKEGEGAEENPFQIDYSKNRGVPDDGVAAGLDLLKEKIGYAKKLGKNTEAEILQSWNGYGKVGKHTEGEQEKMYGIDLGKGNIDMAKEPVYGKRIIDLRENVIKKSPELVKLVEGERNTIAYQQENGIKHGALETLNDGRVVIHALESPDFSTMAHEIAHVFEKDLTDHEKKTVENFGGSEAFARGFERYLRDGKAPTEELKTLFHKFKNWLTNIYRSLKGSPIEKRLTPEIKQIFDRLLTEQEEQSNNTVRSSKQKGGDAKAIYAQVEKMDELTSADEAALHYLAGGGKVSESSVNDVVGSTKRPSLNNGNPEAKSSEVKIRDYASKDGNSINEISHSLWEGLPEHLQDSITTEDLRNSLEEHIAAHNTRLSAAMELKSRYIEKMAEKQIPAKELAVLDENEIAELHDKIAGLSEEHTSELVAVLEKYTDKDGTVDWGKLKKDSNDFDSDLILSYSLNEIIHGLIQEGQQPEGSEHTNAGNKDGGKQKIEEPGTRKQSAEPAKGSGQQSIEGTSSNEENLEQGQNITQRSTSGRIKVEPITGQTPRRTSEVMKDLAHGFKQRIIFSKSKGRNAAGSYNTSDTGIKLSFGNDLDVTAHELGHAFDDRHGILTTPTNAIKAELKPFEQYGSTPPKNHPKPDAYKLAEGFAEFVRAYIVNPDAAKKAAPETFKVFDNALTDKERKAIEKYSNDVRVLAGADGLDRIIAQMDAETKPTNILKQVAENLKKKDGYTITWADRLRANFTNPFRAMDKAVDFAKGLQGLDELVPKNDPILLSRLLLGYNGRFDALMNNGLEDATGKTLTDKKGNPKTLNWMFENLDNSSETAAKRDMKLAEAYMIAERTVELSKRFQREHVLTGIGGGLFSDVEAANDAVKAFKNLPKEQQDRLQTTITKYREIADHALQYMVDKGRMSQEAYDQIKADNLQYVAMKRVMDSGVNEEISAFKPNTAGGVGSKKEVIKKITGSSKEIVSPFVSLVDNLHRIYREADRNDIMVQFRDLLVNHRGMNDGDPKNFAAIGIKVPEANAATLPIFIKGKVEHWQFDPELKKALTGLDGVFKSLPKAITILPSTLRWMVTHFPAFAARNFVRDLQDRLIKSSNSGITDLVGDKKHWQEVAQRGGLNAGHYFSDRASYEGLLNESIHELSKNKNVIIANPIKAGKYLWNSYTKLLEKSETVNRVAEYRGSFNKAKEKGMSDFDAQLYAAGQSREMLDFAMMGHYMKVINQLVPFSNAAVQGLRTDAKRLIARPATFAARLAIYSVIPQIAIWFLNHNNKEDGDEYESLPAYQRDLYWNYKIGANNWLAIPKPYELSLPAATVDRMLSKIVYDQKDAYEGFDGTVARSLIPIDEAAMAGPLKTVVEIMANKDFFRDKAIIPPYETNLDLALRKTQNASRLGKVLQELVGMDARNADYFIMNTFAAFGKSALSLSDLGRKDSHFNFSVNDLGFSKNSPAYNSKEVQNMLDYAKRYGLGNKIKPFSNQLEDYFAAETSDQQDVEARKLVEVAKHILDKFKANDAGGKKVRKKLEEVVEE